jgi:prepilin-type N-terminal cleavage/methylation domain-containing protein
MKNLNKKGFTLIELLVVVAIIAILAGIVLVSLNSAREKGEKASLQSTMASVMTVLAMCENEGSDILDVPTDFSGEGPHYICDSNEIDEEWPELPADLASKDYSYALNTDKTLLVGTKTDTDGTTTLVECSIATGSCQNPTE